MPRKRQRTPKLIRQPSRRSARNASVFELFDSWLTGTIHSMRQSWSVNNLVDFVVESVRRSHADDSPFYHLRFDGEMLEAMPVVDDYRALSGKAKLRNRRPDGKPTRIKIDLFPEYIRHLPPKKRAVWNLA